MRGCLAETATLGLKGGQVTRELTESREKTVMRATPACLVVTGSPAGPD